MIAAELHISPKTVKNHISNILMKLQIDNRIQAAVYAVRSGSSSEAAATQPTASACAGAAEHERSRRGRRCVPSRRSQARRAPAPRRRCRPRRAPRDFAICAARGATARPRARGPGHNRRSACRSISSRSLVGWLRSASADLFVKRFIRRPLRFSVRRPRRSKGRAAHLRAPTGLWVPMRRVGRGLLVICARAAAAAGRGACSAAHDPACDCAPSAGTRQSAAVAVDLTTGRSVSHATPTCRSRRRRTRS